MKKLGKKKNTRLTGFGAKKKKVKTKRNIRIGWAGGTKGKGTKHGVGISLEGVEGASGREKGEKKLGRKKGGGGKKNCSGKTGA